METATGIVLALCYGRRSFRVPLTATVRWTESRVVASDTEAISPNDLNPGIVPSHKVPTRFLPPHGEGEGRFAAEFNFLPSRAILS